MIEYKNGIHLKGTGLWFDSKKKTGLSFISSADIDKFTPPEKIIATPETIKFLENKIKKSVLLTCPYFRPFTLGNLQVELIPSGHMLGSSQMVVDKGGKTLIYAGDIYLKTLPTVEPIKIKHCDVLVLKCSCAVPESTSPTTEESIELLIEFIEDAFSSKFTPMIGVEPFGIGQDIIKILGANGFKLSLHQSIYNVTKTYEAFGINFGEFELFKPSNLEQKVLIIPPDKLDSGSIEKIKNTRSAMIIDCSEEMPTCIAENKADEVFVFTSKAGYKELLEYVEKVNPNKVYLIDKYANEFAKTLVKKGYETIALEKPEQLNLL